MTSDAHITLHFIARQTERALAEIAAMRANVAALTATTRRLEVTMSALLAELHAAPPNCAHE